MGKLKVGDLVYEAVSGRTGVIVNESVADDMDEIAQLTFDWFVEVHWISAEKKFSETFFPSSEYVLTSSLKLVSKS